LRSALQVKMDPRLAFAISPAAAETWAMRGLSQRPRPHRRLAARIERKALFSKAPPPPPSLWQQPATWAVVVVTCVSALIVTSLLRRRRKKASATSKLSMGDMNFQLEKSMGVQTDVKQPTAPRTPRAPVPLKSTAPAPIPVPSPVPTPAATAAPPTPATMPPPQIPLPATAEPPSEPVAAPVPETASSAQAVEPPPESKPAEASSKDQEVEKKGFGWLLNRSKAGKVKPLSELLADTEESKLPAKFLRAVASELCGDAPAGVFDGVEGITMVPSTVPEATRSMLLHAGVKSEAERLEPKDCAEGIVMVANSMVAKMVDRVADLKDKKEKQTELDKLVLFARSAEGLGSELAPDVEVSKPTYEGELRYKTLESLYDLYLERAVDDIQSQTTAMMSAMMGGEDKAAANVEKMQAKAEQDEKARTTLAAIFKISEGKAEKLMEKKVQVMTEQAQKEMLAGLGNLGGTS